jgi:hypothetical protein
MAVAQLRSLPRRCADPSGLGGWRRKAATHSATSVCDSEAARARPRREVAEASDRRRRMQSRRGRAS